MEVGVYTQKATFEVHMIKSCNTESHCLEINTSCRHTVTTCIHDIVLGALTHERPETVAADVADYMTSLGSLEETYIDWWEVDNLGEEWTIAYREL
eukprot:31709-Eustigmatos_ZCMA.PRE.1